MTIRVMLTLILFLNVTSGCDFFLTSLIPPSPKGKFLQVRYPPDNDVGLQIEAPNDDACQFLLLSEKKATGEKPLGNMACSEISASQSLRYQATIRKKRDLMEIETTSLEDCKSFIEKVLNAPASDTEKALEKHTEWDSKTQYVAHGKIKTPEDYEGPEEIQVASECQEKH